MRKMGRSGSQARARRRLRDLPKGAHHRLGKEIDPPPAIAARHFLNDNVRELPPEHRAAVCRALHGRWPSAFFELIVGRTLWALGAAVEVGRGASGH